MKIVFLSLIFLTLIGPLYILFSGQIDFHADYRTANRASAHLAPNPATTSEAVIQAYSARAFNWRGIFATHTWIATKKKNDSDYTVYQVIGWRFYRGLPALTIANDIPDRNWFNQKPTVIFDLRGDDADKLIPRIAEAAKSYPFANDYLTLPGPNSNTLLAYIGRLIPELGLSLPSTAIGKDYLPYGQFFVRAPSGTGYQISLFGLVGVLIAKKEGIEINLLGLVYGLRFSPFAIKLPGIGS